MQISAAATITVKDKLMAISFSESERRIIARWLEGVPGKHQSFYGTSDPRSIIPLDKGETT